MLFNQSGIDEKTGKPWSVVQNGVDFEIKVGGLSRTYRALYPPIFGIDVSDTAEINRILDEMFEELEQEPKKEFIKRIPELVSRMKNGETLVFPAVGGTIKVKLIGAGKYSIISTDSERRKTRSRFVNHRGVIAYLNLLSDLAKRFETWSEVK